MPVILGVFQDSVEQFKLGVAECVAKAFNELTGSNFEAGNQSRAHEPLIANSSPANLALLVALWGEHSHSPQLSAVRARVQQEVFGWYEGQMKVEVFFNIIGQPDISNMFLEDLLGGVPQVSTRTINCLERSGIKSVGDLLGTTQSELLYITNFGQASLDLVNDRLAEHGLAIRKGIIKY